MTAWFILWLIGWAFTWGLMIHYVEEPKHHFTMPIFLLITWPYFLTWEWLDD